MVFTGLLQRKTNVVTYSSLLSGLFKLFCLLLFKVKFPSVIVSMTKCRGTTYVSPSLIEKVFSPIFSKTGHLTLLHQHLG